MAAAAPTIRTNSLYPSQAGLGYPGIAVPPSPGGGTVERNPAGETPRLPHTPDTGTDLFSRIRNWKPARQRPAPYSERDLWNRNYVRVHGQLPSQLTKAWESFYRNRVREERGQPLLADSQIHVPVWDQTNNREYRRAFEEEFLPHPERISDPNAPNIAGLLTELGSATAYDRELFAQMYRTDIDANAKARREKMLADPHLKESNKISTELRKAMKALETELGKDLDITRTAGYKHELAEALRAENAAFAAAGMTQSGARGRSLTRLASRLAAGRTEEAAARRRADITARAGLLRGADAELLRTLGLQSGAYREAIGEEFQQKGESIATQLDNRLAALRQKAGSAAEAIQLMHEDYLDEMDRRERDDLEALNTARVGKGLAHQERASRRASRDKRFGAMLQLAGDLVPGIPGFGGSS